MVHNCWIALFRNDWVHNTSLQCRRYLAHFLRSLSLIESASSGNKFRCLNIMAFGVSVGNWTSSFTEVRGRLLSAILTSRITSLSSLQVRSRPPLQKSHHPLELTVPPWCSAQVKLPCDLLVCQIVLRPLVLHDASQPFCCSNETSPVVRIHLLWSSSSCYEPLQAFDEFLSSLVAQ